MKITELFRGIRVAQIGVAAAIVCTAGLIVVLSMEVRALQPQALELKNRKSFPYVSQWVPTVRAPTIDGDTVTIGETSRGRSQVLIFFTASCPYCLQTLPHWQKITKVIANDIRHPADVYWVSLSSADSTRRYIAEHKIDAPIVFPSDWKMTHVYRVKGVPMTLVLDYRGRITHAHPSMFSNAAEIDSVISIASTQSKAGSDKSPPLVSATLPR